MFRLLGWNSPRFRIDFSYRGASLAKKNFLSVVIAFGPVSLNRTSGGNLNGITRNIHATHT